MDWLSAVDENERSCQSKEMMTNILDASFEVLSAERRTMGAEEVMRRGVDGGMR